jgi:hypothetical protein
MVDSERAQPPTPDGILSPEEIQEIRERVALRWATEQKARKRKTPRWDPDSPWRSLEHTFIATLKACKEISTEDLEAILGHRLVWISGTRDDLIGELPDRFEEVLARADRRLFSFSSNSIFATFSDPPDHAALFGPRSRVTTRSSIEFSNVRVHWPKLVVALQQAGFKISMQRPKPAATAGGRRRPKRNTSPRAKMPDARFRKWYERRLNECAEKHEHRSEADDWEAAQAEFGDKVRRDQVRELRRELAPSEWRKRGRPRKTVLIRAVKKSAE